MRKIFFLVIIISLWSCDKKHNSQEIISVDEAKNIEKMLDKVPPTPVGFSVEIYVIDENNYLRKIDFSYLKSLYDLEYKKSFRSLNSFIYSVTNQKVRLKKTDFDNRLLSCNLDINISQVYHKNNIEGLINKYCFYDKHKNRFLLNSKKLLTCEIETISYYFFLNKYYRSSNDYSNRISFSKNKSSYFNAK